MTYFYLLGLSQIKTKTPTDYVTDKQFTLLYYKIMEFFTTTEIMISVHLHRTLTFISFM